MHPALKALQSALDPDRVLMNSMGALIESNGIRHALNKGVEGWTPGKPLKLILAVNDLFNLLI